MLAGQIESTLPIAALAASAGSLLTIFVKSRLERRNSEQIEQLRSQLQRSSEQIALIRQSLFEHFPTLLEDAYRTRNAARDLVERLPEIEPAIRNDLGNVAMRFTDRLYVASAFMDETLFGLAHAYKKSVHRFVIEYDLITGGNPDRLLGRDDLHLRSAIVETLTELLEQYRELRTHLQDRMTNGEIEPERNRNA